MWQTVLVVLAVAAAGWYVLRRLRRNLKPASGSSCACGGHDGGPCPLPGALEELRPSQCQGCDQCPPPSPPARPGPPQTPDGTRTDDA